MADLENTCELAVFVDGERWAEIASFESAGPNDKVFVLDRTSGTLRFGDGEHGRQPNTGVEITAFYRTGGGSAGNVQISVTGQWPPTTGQYQISTLRDGIRIARDDSDAEQYSGGRRVRYFSGQLLDARDFQDEQDYHRQMRYLHNRFFHGPGVITGLEVGIGGAPPDVVVVVTPGYAVDAMGRDIVLKTPVELEVREQCSPQYVTIEYSEQQTDFVPIPNDEGTAATRIEEGSLLRLAADEHDNALAIGRIVLGNSGWEVDSTFQPYKPR